ncbi:nucleoside kinase [uncultured Treponema sp.]|uniref:nucleoside kinase n=1 Tax=uncultured Treponema sp. TaxID=162155 RepID=UPI0025EED525|nr:nucleoside kinase [uncultured Treponema sp.]
MNKITLTFTDGKKIEVDARVRGKDIQEHLPAHEGTLVAIKVNNKLVSLCRPIRVSSRIEGVYQNSKEGSYVYRRSLSFILAAAVHKLFPDARLVIGHSLGYSYYYTIERSSGALLSVKELDSIKAEMLKIVENDTPIITKHIAFDEAAETFTKLGLIDTAKQLLYRCRDSILVNMLDDESQYIDIYFGSLVETCGILKVFDLVLYADGFLLKFPQAEKPEVVAPFEDSPKIFEIFSRYKKWGKLVNVSTVASLNEIVSSKKINDFIDICETYQMQNYARVARMIHDRGNVKVVLIAGPSSSGKTTSAFKMALHLRSIGYNPKTISLDSYYVGRDRNPKDENGNYDYECLEALDIELLNQNLIDLFAGKEVEIPCYNFDLGQRYYTGTNKMTLGPTDILILEGIHGLNDRLTPLIKSEYKFKIYLSALTQLNFDEHNRIPTSDNRLIRRIVRDANFRGKPAAGTIAMWDSVQRGEKLHIFPFQNSADAVLNTALDYEIPVLKIYAEPKLRAVRPDQPEYSEACRLINFLSHFNAISSDYVPKQSLVREFIGGSAFKY